MKGLAPELNKYHGATAIDVVPIMMSMCTKVDDASHSGKRIRFIPATDPTTGSDFTIILREALKCENPLKKRIFLCVTDQRLVKSTRKKLVKSAPACHVTECGEVSKCGRGQSLKEDTHVVGEEI